MWVFLMYSKPDQIITPSMPFIYTDIKHKNWTVEYTHDIKLVIFVY